MRKTSGAAGARTRRSRTGSSIGRSRGSLVCCRAIERSRQQARHAQRFESTDQPSHDDSGAGLFNSVLHPSDVDSGAGSLDRVRHPSLVESGAGSDDNCADGGLLDSVGNPSLVDNGAGSFD